MIKELLVIAGLIIGVSMIVWLGYLYGLIDLTRMGVIAGLIIGVSMIVWLGYLYGLIDLTRMGLFDDDF
jgi:asparagine N-glycosylation enzyme membrane subunit Stt3